MRSVVASVVVAAGLAVVAFAQSGSQPGGQPARQPGGQPAAVQPAEPPKPAGIPVPDMPVVEKKELEGGLILEDLKIGTGYEIKPGDAVVALYHGTLKEGGTVFDSAFERGEPISFSLNGVIQGWQQGVPGMKIGGIRRLTIPYALAYGEAGSPPRIPAKADLVFVIQLVDAPHFEDVTVGTGDEVWGPCVAVTHYSLTTESGEKSSTQGKSPYIWIPGEMQYGPRDDAMQSALKGMKVGGKRKVHIPKAMNRELPQMELTRPTDVACDFELELIGVRNLQPRPATPAPTSPPPAATPVPTK